MLAFEQDILGGDQPSNAAFRSKMDRFAIGKGPAENPIGGLNTERNQLTLDPILKCPGAGIFAIKDREIAASLEIQNAGFNF